MFVHFILRGKVFLLLYPMYLPLQGVCFIYYILGWKITDSLPLQILDNEKWPSHDILCCSAEMYYWFLPPIPATLWVLKYDMGKQMILYWMVGCVHWTESAVILFVNVILNNAIFPKDLLASFMFFVLCSGDKTNIFLVFSVFTCRPTSLLGCNKALWFSLWCLCFCPIN
jgi:hypothetical protein